MTQQTLSTKSQRKAQTDAWKAVVKAHQKPHHGRALWQVINSMGAYMALWVLMYFTLQISWWLTLPIAVLAAGLLVRCFIIFHDCGHGSFFRPRWANAVCGYVCGVLCFTPYYHWRWQHALHHATAGDLDHRGAGDVWTMTVQEYLEASPWKRFSYRLARNPFILFVVAPFFLFVISQRFSVSKAAGRERISVWWMNAAVAGQVILMSWIFGIVPYAILMTIIVSVSGTAGIWLFYVQHQFEDAYWERNDEWDYTAAALQGSSFYKLPKVLQWFSGNIGFHHIHHLSPKVPNYNLERCHNAHPMFQNVKSITLLGSFRSMSCHLWDESSKKLISFREFRKMQAGQRHDAA